MSKDKKGDGESKTPQDKGVGFSDLLCDWQEVRERLGYFYMKTDGIYEFPNNKEGDLLKMVHNILIKQVT